MDNPRDKFSLMIPAYLRGELSPVEVQRLEAAAKTDPEIEADIELQRRLREANQPEEASNEGWSRLQAAMKSSSSRSELPKPALAIVAENDDIGTSKPFKAANSNERNGVSPFWRIAAVALAVIGIGHVSLTMSDDTSQEIYVTASDAGNDARSSFKIGFSDSAELTDITALLANNDGQIISGPSSLGLYTVAYENLENCQAGYTEFSALASSAIVETLSTCE